MAGMGGSYLYTEVLGSFFPGPSLERRFKDLNYRPGGFDYMRIVLALSVIFVHAGLISYGAHPPAGKGQWAFLTVPRNCIVPLFFALSGFLVAGSLDRSKTLFTFFGLRILRIAPALSVEVAISALIVGPWLTTLPPRAYFSDTLFYSYLQNIVGDIHYRLPGVFEQNPTQLVNGQLWTVPYELVCYVMLALAAVVGLFKSKSRMLAFLVLFYVAQTLNTIIHPNQGFQGVTGSTVVGSFIAGLVVYRFRDSVPWSFRLFVVSLASIAFCIYFVQNGVRFIALPAAYMAAYLGMLNPPRHKIISSGDYSYGIYLYGFPVQQTICTLLPDYREWYFNLLFSLPLIVCVAVFSWWVVEKPTLSLRSELKSLDDRILQWRGKAVGEPPLEKADGT
jgi:peptidoglycan/LPS O-acetylase OafA/YrhL